MSLSKRILIDSILVLSILFLPWYIIVAMVLLVYWKYDLIEIVLVGLIMDIVYGSYFMHSFEFIGRWLAWIPFLPFTYGAVATVWVLSLIKKRIR